MCQLTGACLCGEVRYGPMTAKLCVLATAGECSAKAPRNKGLRHGCSGRRSSDICRSQGSAAANQIGGTFRQHHHDRMYMRRRHVRQRRGIDHPQSFDAADPQIRVEHRVRTASDPLPTPLPAIDREDKKACRSALGGHWPILEWRLADRILCQVSHKL
jgi:hypothetical protein